MSPLDKPYNTLSSQPPDPREANYALADRLDYIDRHLADTLRLCADGSLICNRRYCARCAQARSARMAARYKLRLDRMAKPHHLTLTNYPVDVLTRQALNATGVRFTLMRRRAMTAAPKIKIAGGVRNIEIDVDSTGKRWLIGLHAVIDAPEKPSTNWIRENWQALGGGREVLLEPITPGTTTRTFAYSTKASTLPTSADLLHQFVRATHGFRATMPFGSIHPRTGKPPKRRGQGGAKAEAESSDNPTCPGCDQPWSGGGWCGSCATPPGWHP